MSEKKKHKNIRFGVFVANNEKNIYVCGRITTNFLTIFFERKGRINVLKGDVGKGGIKIKEKEKQASDNRL